MGIQVIFKGADFEANGFPISGGIDPEPTPGPTPDPYQAAVDAQLLQASIIPYLTTSAIPVADTATHINHMYDTRNGGWAERSTLAIPSSAAEHPYLYNDVFDGMYSFIYLPEGLKSVSVICDAIQGRRYGLCLIDSATYFRAFDSGWGDTGIGHNKSFDTPTEHPMYLFSTFDGLLDSTAANINYIIEVSY